MARSKFHSSHQQISRDRKEREKDENFEPFTNNVEQINGKQIFLNAVRLTVEISFSSARVKYAYALNIPSFSLTFLIEARINGLELENRFSHTSLLSTESLKFDISLCERERVQRKQRDVIKT